MPPSLKLRHLWPIADQVDEQQKELERRRRGGEGELDTNPDSITWIQANFYIPELNGPIQLMPYHVAVLREACSRDEAGNFRYSLILWGDIKKSIKSSIAAAIALYRAVHTDWGSIKVIANDLKQAD